MAEVEHISDCKWWTIPWESLPNADVTAQPERVLVKIEL